MNVRKALAALTIAGGYDAQCDAEYDRMCDLEDAIAGKAAEMMSRGADCDPFSPENFSEALAEMRHADRDRIAALFAENSQTATEDAGFAIRKCVSDYWLSFCEAEARYEIEHPRYDDGEF